MNFKALTIIIVTLLLLLSAVGSVRLTERDDHDLCRYPTDPDAKIVLKEAMQQKNSTKTNNKIWGPLVQKFKTKHIILGRIVKKINNFLLESLKKIDRKESNALVPSDYNFDEKSKLLLVKLILILHIST
jgi:hypothetical protein